MASAPRLFLPNKIGRLLLLSLEEIVGHNGLNAVLNVAGVAQHISSLPPNTLDRQFAFDDLGHIHQALDRLYGVRAGRGLALRTGRAAFPHALREFGPMIGLTELPFRLGRGMGRGMGMGPGACFGPMGGPGVGPGANFSAADDLTPDLEDGGGLEMAMGPACW